MIIREIITMSHKLGLTVVAEGVEEEKQMQYLRESGCDIAGLSLQQSAAQRRINQKTEGVHSLSISTNISTISGSNLVPASSRSLAAAAFLPILFWLGVPLTSVS